MKKITIISCIMLTILMLFSACAAAAPKSEAPAYAVEKDMESAPAAAPQEGGTFSQETNNAPALAQAVTSGNGNEAEGVKRIVIKNATIGIVVKDPGTSMDHIGKMAEEMGGFIVSSNIYKTKTRDGVEVPQAEISIRVPAEQLTQAIETIKVEVVNLDTGILTENITGSDVTKEYTDLKSRLTNLENAAEQLKNIMDNAEKTEDVMAVYNQLMQVNEQIEVLKGQIKYYDEASSLSQITVTLRSEASIAPLTLGGWKPEGTARDAVQALITTLEVLGRIAIWLIIYFLPLLIIFALLAGLAFIIIRAIYRLFKPKAKPQLPKA